MKNLPWYLITGFIIITLITLFALYKATGKSKLVLLLSSGWLLLQGFISNSGFYTVTDTMPPRFLLTLLFPILLILWLLLSKRGKKFTANHSLKDLTLLHSIRILVELGLYSLSVYKVIPELMTFEGRNFDIMAGLTAPLVYYFGFIRQKLSTIVILMWNFICVALLANIVIHAMLAAPFPFQQLAFEQANIALLYFPFTWLPGFIVPVVLYAHLVSIQRLTKK